MTPEMTPERWRQITAVFHTALAREPETRQAFLDDACAADSGIRAEVERLLAAHQGAGPFGDAPVHATAGASALETGTAAAIVADAPAVEASPESVRRQPFLALVWVVSAATLVTFAHAAWLIASAGTAWFGWDPVMRDGHMYVASVEAGGPTASQLKPGDRLLSLNGRPLVGMAGVYFQRRDVAVGETYELAIERDGQPQAHRLLAEANTNVAVQLTWFMVSLVWCGVGLFIGFARPDTPLPRLACAAAVATGHVFLQGGVIHSGPLWGPLHIILGCHFFSRFPTGAPSRGVWTWALALMYVFATPYAALNLLAHGTVLAVGGSAAAALLDPYAPLFRNSQLLALPPFLLATFGMILLLPRNYRRLTDENDRRRVRWVVLGSTIALVPQIWWAAVHLYEQFIGPSPVSQYNLFANALTVAIPMVVAYAVVKHRVLDIGVVVRRGLRYLLARRVLQMAVALPVVVLAYTVVSHRDLTIAEFVRDTRGYLFWLGAAALALRFRGPIQLWLDRRFFRDESDREQLLLGMLDEVGKVDSIAELSRLVSDRLASALHPMIAYVWYRDRDELAVASSSDPLLTPADLPSTGRWLAFVERRSAVTTLPFPAAAGLPGAEARWFSDRGIRLIVPITDSTEALVGALLLGEKKSDEPYTARDEQLLGAIAKQAAVVRENLRLRARVSDEVRVRHDVLARLDGRLPGLLKECPACGACFDGDVERCARDGATLTLSLPVSRTIDGKYRLDQLIGKGGMGAVYEARDLRLDRSVAVKVLLGRAFGHQPALRRFRREARAAAQLNHPNIVAVYDVGSLEGQGAYLVMERVHGLTLRAAFDRGQPLAPAVAAEWFDQILDGLAAAHAHGIVHRDLKPDNIMGKRDDAGVLAVKILDLGLVKFRDESPSSGTMTAVGVVMGTLGYMSPEQLLGNPVDHRTDLFAVAVMSIEALTGRRPFQGETYAELWRSLQTTTVRLPGSSREVHAFNELLARCLAADPADRFPSAAALRQELIPLLRHLG